jgi:ketosteroid isomerase-like protein
MPSPLVRSASLLLVIVLVCSCTPPASRAIARITAESEVRLAERQRFDAMMHQDVAALDTLLDDELTYVHTGGELQSRQQFIDMIRNRTLVYELIAPSDVHVRVYDGLALATGRSQQRVRNASGVQSFGIRFIEVYVRRDGRWLLTAWEATRLG